VLSGGEKIRLCFARIFVNPPNLLILDEPTTHLDIAGREILQEVLQNYKGTLCLVSHDIEFVRNVATTIIAMKEHGVKKYFGNYDYFLEKTAAETAAAAPATVKVAEKTDNAKLRRQERAKQRQALSAEKKAAEKRVAELEQKVEKLDARQQELLAKLAEPPGADFGDLMRESAIVQDKLDAATALWEEAMEKLEEILAANAAIHED
jgi:ATP-binding cassette subfamily F protein 3